MLKTIEVVDDFHPDPWAVRASALALDWRTADGGHAPSPGIWSAEAAVDRATGDRLVRLLGPGAGRGPGSPRALFTAVGEASPRPAVERLGHPGWTALVWLCEPADRRGGMSFYRNDGPTAAATGGQPGDDADETMFIPAKFNRLVLFRSSIPHRRGPGFGRSPSDGLLSQVIFVPPEQAAQREVPCAAG